MMLTAPRTAPRVANNARVAEAPAPVRLNREIRFSPNPSEPGTVALRMMLSGITATNSLDASASARSTTSIRTSSSTISRASERSYQERTPARSMMRSYPPAPPYDGWMRTLQTRPLAILVATMAVAVTGGCGSHNFSDSAPSTELLSGATAAAGSRIAPAGGPYSYRVPAHWHSIARFTVGSVSAKTRYRSAIARGSGLIYAASSDRGTADPHSLGMQYAQELKRLGMSVESVSAALVGNSPAFVFDINDVPVPGGGTGSAPQDPDIHTAGDHQCDLPVDRQRRPEDDAGRLRLGALEYASVVTRTSAGRGERRYAPHLWSHSDRSPSQIATRLRRCG